MEVDRILYIFGSFSRKKQDKRKSLEPSSISAGNSPLHAKAQRPHSQTLAIAPRTSAYFEPNRRKSQLKEWNCGICRKELVEPRLLACLHSFCTRCLQGMHQEGEAEVWSAVDAGSIQLEAGDSRLGSGAGSAGSGYESDLRHSGSEGSLEQKPQKYGIFTRKISGKSVQFLICPTCNHETSLPLGGISALPLNYVLLRKMAAAQDDSLRVLCDLCNSDNRAVSKCVQCVVSVCSSCSEAHGRQKATARHPLQPLELEPVKFCSQHPRAELSVYCATCQQVVCRECCVVSHSGHALSSASRAASERARVLRDACERAAHVPEHVERAARVLNVHAHEVDSQAGRVEAEIQVWRAQYRSAVEAHAHALAAAAARARAHYRHRVERTNTELQRTAQHARDAVSFAQELLSEAKAEELLSLSGPVVRRLEAVCEGGARGAAPRCELRFAPTAPAPHDRTLVGRLLTTTPDPDACTLITDGFQDLRVDCQHEAILELRDSSGERIWCGDEQVAGYLRRRDSWARPAAAAVRARRDGSRSLAVTPRAPGAYLLAVTVNNKPIKVCLGSPVAHSRVRRECAKPTAGSTTAARSAHRGGGETPSAAAVPPCQVDTRDVGTGTRAGRARDTGPAAAALRDTPPARGHYLHQRHHTRRSTSSPCDAAHAEFTNDVTVAILPWDHRLMAGINNNLDFSKLRLYSFRIIACFGERKHREETCIPINSL